MTDKRKEGVMVALVSNKGGVEKTTSVNLAADVAAWKRHVLLVYLAHHYLRW